VEIYLYPHLTFSSFCHRSTPSRIGVRDVIKTLFSGLYLQSTLLNRRIKTAEALIAAGVPSTVILDSAVAYVMDKVDFVLVGSEAVVESGGLVNAVGSNQIAIIARAAHKPFYALAERYFCLYMSTIKIDYSHNVLL
jgi:hypothetical protein